MKDDLPYFSHDNDARNHPKMKALRARFGWTGYGQFWALNEMIAGASQARLDLSRKVVRSAVACELGMTTDALDDLLKFLSDNEECGLIEYQDGVVTTDRTQEDYDHVIKMREQKSAAGKASAMKKAFNSTAVEESPTAVEKTSTAVEEWNGKNQENRTEQNRTERTEQHTQEACVGDVPEDDPGLVAYAQETAKKARARNVTAYARSLVAKPEFRAEYLESMQPQEQPYKRAPPPYACSECGGDLRMVAGDAVCKSCGAAWSWDDSFDVWARAGDYIEFDMAQMVGSVS